LKSHKLSFSYFKWRSRIVQNTILQQLLSYLWDTTLDVTNGTGASLSVLAQTENKLLASLLIETEFDNCTEELGLNVEPSNDRDRIRKLISQVPFLPPKEALARYEMVFKCGFLDAFRFDSSKLEKLDRVVRFFSENFITTVELLSKPLDREIIKYSYDSKFAERSNLDYNSNTTPDDGAAVAQGSQLHRLVDQRPFSFRLSIPLAFVTPSYHFRMEGPKGSYCHRQYIRANK
jgi:hypothetical protein